MLVGPQTIKHSTVAAKSVTPRKSAAGGMEYVVEMTELYTGCTQTITIAFHLAVRPSALGQFPSRLSDRWTALCSSVGTGFEVSNLRGAPGSTVHFSVSTSNTTALEFTQVSSPKTSRCFLGATAAIRSHTAEQSQTVSRVIMSTWLCSASSLEAQDRALTAACASCRAAANAGGQLHLRP